MKSFRNAAFRKRFDKLPARVQKQARRAYAVWRRDPNYSSLEFKQVHATLPFYSVRIGLHWHAVGVRDKNEIVWFWIGSHAEYDALIQRL